MLPFGSLWLPVVLSALATWIISAISWMVLPLHKKDYLPVPDEDAMQDALRKQGVQAGQYSVPHCDHGKMKDPDFQAKLAKGPTATITVLPPGPPSMGKALSLWLGYCILAGFVVATIARHALPAGADRGDVFCLTVTAFLGIHVVSQLPDWIWRGRSLRTTLTQMVDGVLYSLAGAALFACLWPSAA